MLAQLGRRSRRPQRLSAILSPVFALERRIDPTSPPRPRAPLVEGWFDSVIVAWAADVAAHVDKIPTVRSNLEAASVLPGPRAVGLHRLAHQLSIAGHRIGARLLAEAARQATGIEIAPGADVEARLVISHGAGVVVGETARIGSDVHMFHGVTLGSSRRQFSTHAQRHPTIEKNVTLYANATVLGGTTVVGWGSVIGAGVTVHRSVPPGSIMRR